MFIMTHPRLFCITYVLLFLSFASPLDVQEGQDVSQREDSSHQERTTTRRGLQQPKQIDESFPMTSVEAFQRFDTNTEQRELYSQYMEGCYRHMGREICDKNEKDRLARNALQPPSVQNLTATGYAKMTTPATTQHILESYIETFADNLDLEDWGRQTHTNHWARTTDSHNIEFFMPLADRRIIQREVQEVLEKWCGLPLTFTSMYGIRVYREGAVLAPHVDRLPMVISAILNVLQDIDDKDMDDWPLEVIGRDGIAVNLTLQPGEMILYESHSIIHGRPYPLKKWYYANMFLHFEPVGYSYNLQRDHRNSVKGQVAREDMARDAFHKALAKRQPTKSIMPKRQRSVEFPSYISEDTDQKLRFSQDFIFQREPKKPLKVKKTVGATEAHTVAANGDLGALKQVVDRDPSVVDQADVNGWKPVHEAARGGQYQVLQYLIEKGVDVNERTHNGKGASPLWWAERNFPENHPAVVLLKKHGARSLPPKDE